MTNDVREHCLEPFFTTRTRRISTGLGLALVRGAVCNINGTIEIDSQPGAGTTFRLTLPASVSDGLDHASPDDRGSALVDVNDKRRAAYIASLLRSMGFDARAGAWDRSAGPTLLVLDADRCRWDDLRSFLEGGMDRRTLIFGECVEATSHPQAACIDEAAAPQLIRAALRQIVTAAPRAEEVLHT